MRNFSPWPMLVLLLAGVLFLREPRFQKTEEFYLRWLLRNTQTRGLDVPLTVVAIGHDRLLEQQEATDSEEVRRSGATTISPLEYALFLQSVLEFLPPVVAFENILRWREGDQDQEQVYLDQAMRVPKLLLGAELTDTPEPDAALPEIPAFKEVSGRRSDLAAFSGISQQPNEDLRLISSLGFVNLPEDPRGARVPLLFMYRGDVIPAFALQAVMLWLRVTPAEVKIELGSHILLPDGRKIPIASDGTMLINPNAARKARRMTLNELLLAAQQRGTGGVTTAHLEDMREQIVLARTPENPRSPPDVFGAAIATIQSNQYVRRISWLFDCAVIVAVTALAGILRKVSGGELVLGAVAFTAAYCLVSLAVISRWLIWLPGYLPLGVVWLMVLINIFSRRASRIAQGGEA